MNLLADQPVRARAIDAVALNRLAVRLQSAPQPPWLHREVARRMAARLPIIKLQPPRVLDWWSTTGGGVDFLRAAYPKAELLQLEPDFPGRHSTSATPAAPAARWWSWPRRRGAAPLPMPLSDAQLQPACAELVWANMGLHRWADPQRAFERWHYALEMDGFLMFSTLGPGTLTTLQALYSHAGWPPPFAPFVDMHDLGDMLVHAGFADPVMDQEQLTLTWATPQAALDELRLMGSNAHPARAAGLRTPRWLQRVRQALAATAGPSGRVELTFELVYGHAFKPPPRARLAATTQVPLDDFRRMTAGKKPAR